jgi:predicted unusual protein kinase regulating ubiquinone biosynthesis (AarF/ABC1/UbiB family)
VTAPRRVPRGFLGRSARVVGAAGGRGARHLGTRVANLLRDDERARELLDERHREAAIAAARLLGTMRGGAMKLGQLASFVELDFVPEEYRDVYQAELAALRDAAPPVDWPSARRVLEEEWEAPPESVLGDLDHEPVAAASIGQVHRGRLRDGRRVAVKVQYPGVAEAVETDVRTATVLVRGVRALAPGVDAKALAAELRERVVEELDYELEADHHRLFARAYRGHPFAYVPDVVGELCRRRILVSEWVDGAGFAEVRELPQPARDRFGEVLSRFYFGALDVVGAFNADPHPGNYLLRPDGSVAFLDFGAVKRITRAYRESQNAIIRLYLAGDGEGVRSELARAGWFREPERFDPDLVMRGVHATGWHLLEDRPVTITPELVREQLAAMSDPRNELVKALRGTSFPPEELWFRRMALGVLAVCAQLRVTANWHRMGREWWFGEPPATELGRQEWAFLSGRSLWRDPRAAAG